MMEEISVKIETGSPTKSTKQSYTIDEAIEATRNFQIR